MTTSTQRTGGMTAIGILNLVFGSFGALFSLLAVVGGGFLAAAGAGFETQNQDPDAAGFGAMAAAGGGIIMLAGLVGLVFWALLLISGVGVLKLAPWGRKLAIICGVMGLGWTAVMFALGGVSFNPMTIATIAYSGLLLFLFMQPQWKAAFVATTGFTATTTATGAEQYRRAA